MVGELMGDGGFASHQRNSGAHRHFGNFKIAAECVLASLVCSWRITLANQYHELAVMTYQVVMQSNTINLTPGDVTNEGRGSGDSGCAGYSRLWWGAGVAIGDGDERGGGGDSNALNTAW